MMHRFLIVLLLAATAAWAGEVPTAPDTRAHAFYYGWYGSPAVDGHEFHWNHEVLGDTTGRAWPGGLDIGANYYPALGAYSSNDPEVVRTHVEQMTGAGIGVAVVSWWGPGSFEDGALPRFLDAAAAGGLEVAFHLEPFPGRGAATSREALAYLVGAYGDHPACHRLDGRPVVYVYDSYLTPAAEWARLLAPDGDLTIRGTGLDCVMIGLWVTENEGAFFLDGGFDGYYTYFAADGFTWGSSRANWPRLAAFAGEHDLLFVPCVGPGYLDTRVRPWNAATTRGRDEGRTYDAQFAAAVRVQPPIIGITSFNEWHEGTQIEPAAPLAIEGFTYEDYRPLEPDAYLARTRLWLDRWRMDRRR
jgi:glycoprotein endo-alpha-1,2-mannosidase